MSSYLGVLYVEPPTDCDDDRPDMRVPARVYASEAMLDAIVRARALRPTERRVRTQSPA